MPPVKPEIVWEVVRAPLPEMSFHAPQPTPHCTLYWYLTMPASSGSFQVSVITPSASVAVSPAGLAGCAAEDGAGALAPCAAPGVASTVNDGSPLPLAFTARTANSYLVPFLRPVTVWETVFGPLPGMFIQGPNLSRPSFCLYW